MATNAPSATPDLAGAAHVIEVVDDCRDSLIDLRRAENDLLDSQYKLLQAKAAYRTAEIALILGEQPVNQDGKALTVAQREAWSEQALAEQAEAVTDADRAVHAHASALRIAQETCRINRVILAALTGLRGE